MGKVSSHSSHTVTVGVRGFVLLLHRLIVTKELCDRNCVFVVLMLLLTAFVSLLTVFLFVGEGGIFYIFCPACK